jgi:hypothetical protein
MFMRIGLEKRLRNASLNITAKIPKCYPEWYNCLFDVIVSFYFNMKSIAPTLNTKLLFKKKYHKYSSFHHIPSHFFV